MITRKNCRRCGANGVVGVDFYKHNCNKDGFSNFCKKCVEVKRKDRAGEASFKKCNVCAEVKGKEHFSVKRKICRKCNALDCWIRKLKRDFNLTPSEFYSMLETQNWNCKICNDHLKNIKSKQLHIDHCHLSGSVRGILCGRCNVGLGQFRDSIKNLESAIKYLKECNP